MRGTGQQFLSFVTTPPPPFATFCSYSRLFASVRHYSHYSYYSLYAIGKSLIARLSTQENESSHKGLTPKAIPLKLFLDIVPGFRRYNSCAALMFSWRTCSCFISFRFKSKQRKASNAVGMSFLTFQSRAKELRLSIYFNTF